jgi:hypothetical protein
MSQTTKLKRLQLRNPEDVAAEELARKNQSIARAARMQQFPNVFPEGYDLGHFLRVASRSSELWNTVGSEVRILRVFEHGIEVCPVADEHWVLTLRTREPVRVYRNGMVAKVRHNRWPAYLIYFNNEKWQLHRVAYHSKKDSLVRLVDIPFVTAGWTFLL